MTISTNTIDKHHPKTAKAEELLSAGLDPAVLWNVDREKDIDSDVFIVATLKNGYNEETVSVLSDFFGREMILDALDHHRERVSEKLYENVHIYLDSSLSAT